jgi:hypothetical protein
MEQILVLSDSRIIWLKFLSYAQYVKLQVCDELVICAPLKRMCGAVFLPLIF